MRLCVVFAILYMSLLNYSSSLLYLYKLLAYVLPVQVKNYVQGRKKNKMLTL